MNVDFEERVHFPRLHRYRLGRTRQALRNPEFGSAAAHHRIYAPWLKPSCCHAGMVGLRGTVSPESGPMQRAAREIKDVLEANGVAHMPVGLDLVEPAMLFELRAISALTRPMKPTCSAWWVPARAGR
jgi:Xaa-Pro dipeptidase